jgi:hypothetical protein
MNTLLRKLFACLSGRQAFIIIMLFFFSAAKAQIIYTNVNPDAKFSCSKAGCSHQYNLDLNNDGVNDFSIIVAGSLSFCGGNHHNFSVSIVPLDSNGVVPTNPLSLNAIINDQSIYDSAATTLESYYSYVLRNVCIGGMTGSWSSSSDGYLGLKLIKRGKTYFGWVRLLISVSSKSASVTIKDYAYNSIRNQFIAAGQSNNAKLSNAIITNKPNTKTGIILMPNPVQNSLRVSALPGETLTGKSATATINIYSSAMQLVQITKVTQADKNDVIIPVDELAAGMYFLQLINAGGVNMVKFVKE